MDPALSRSLQLQDAGNYRQAKAALWYCLAQAPAWVEALERMAVCHFAQGEREAAERALARAESLQEMRPGSLHLRARLHLLAGNLEAAWSTVITALAVEPKAAEGRLIRGVIMLAGGAPEAALLAARRLVVGNPAYAEAWGLVAACRQAMGRLTDAAMDARRALLLKSHMAQVWRLMGAVEMGMGRIEQGLAAYGTYAGFAPGDGDILVTLGNAVLELGREPESRALFRRALATVPDLASAWNNLGSQLRGDPTSAERCFARAVRVQHAFAAALTNLGHLLLTGGRAGAAKDCFRAALSQHPSLPGSLYGLALVNDESDTLLRRGLVLAPYDPANRLELAARLLNRGETQAAETELQAFIACIGDHPLACSMLGNLWKEQARFDDADRVFRRSLVLDPLRGEAMRNYGIFCKEMNRLDMALLLFDRAAALRPDWRLVKESRAYVLFCQGRLDSAWDAYEWREFVPRDLSMPRWDGRPCPSATVLVEGEQGIGDQIMALSMLPEVLTRAGSVVVECEERLAELFRRSFPQARFVRLQKPPTPAAMAADLKISMLSLGRLFRRSQAEFPLHDGYLRPDPRQVGRWRAWLDGLGPGVKLGLAWRGRRLSWHRTRSFLPLSALLPLFHLRDSVFINLQYDGFIEDIRAFEAEYGFRIHRPPGLDLTDDLDGVAALMSALDAVITPNSAVANMAGALGRPSWMWSCYPAGNDEKDYCGSERLPWWPSIRPFRWEPRDAPGAAIAALAASLAGHFNLQPSDAGMALLEQGIQRLEQGRRDLATVCFRSALAMQPGLAAAYNNIGDTGSPGELAANLRRALILDPGFVEAEVNMGLHLAGQNGLACLRRALVKSPQRGDILALLARMREDLTASRRSLLLQPADPRGWLLLGSQLAGGNHFGQSIACLKASLVLAPGDTAAENCLGGARQEDDPRIQGNEHFRRALLLDNGNPWALYNLADALKLSFRFDQAAFLLRHVLADQPDFTRAHDNLGIVMKESGQLAAALRHCDRALQLEPGSRGYREGRAYPLFCLGRVSEAWAAFEARALPQRPFRMPVWDGTLRESSTLLIWGEQGVGDQMLAAGMLTEARRRVAACVVECEPRLVSLFARSFPDLTVVAQHDPPDRRAQAADLQIPMFGLAQILRNDLADFPDHEGYLKPDPDRVAFWSNWLRSLGEGPKIGLSWRCRLAHWNRLPSFIPIERLKPVLTIPGAHYVNLQYDGFQADIDDLRRLSSQPIHVAEGLDLTADLDEVAALMGALDAVVGPDTAVVNLAASLGRPCWMYASYPLGNNEKDLCGQTYSPWWPRMTVVTWGWGEDQNAVVDQIARDLNGYFLENNKISQKSRDLY